MTTTRFCKHCQKEKSIEEFYKGRHPWCKICTIEDNKKRSAVTPKYSAARRKHRKKVYQCIKRLCTLPVIKNSSIVELICPVCGIKFGVEKGNLWYQQRDGSLHIRKNCSQICYWKSMTKYYKNKESPYANNYRKYADEK
jgi:hypothetical protein